MNWPYHEGEQAVQAKAGVLAEAVRVGKSIHSFIPPAAGLFLQQQPMVVVGSLGREDAWASLLSSERGFMQSQDGQTLMISALSRSDDLLRENLSYNRSIGLLAIDLATRKRMRLNGEADITASGLRVMARQVYANCPKYIQARELIPNMDSGDRARLTYDGDFLSRAQIQWIQGADTFFIVSSHPEHGVDASHRGGHPGFVRVLDESHLEFPDYVGNNMFNTLGNISVNSSVGLLFVNFEEGSTLQLRGSAEIHWDAEDNQPSEPQRVIHFHVKRLVEIANATSLRWRFLNYSPSNP